MCVSVMARSAIRLHSGIIPDHGLFAREPNVEEVDSESTSELIAEGQPFETGIIESVEKWPDPDVAQTKTSSRPLFSDE